MVLRKVGNLATQFVPVAHACTAGIRLNSTLKFHILGNVLLAIYNSWLKTSMVNPYIWFK